MAIHTSFFENEEIQQNEEEPTFEQNENLENVQRNLFDEFDEVSSETEETEEYGSEQEDDSSDGIVDENLLYWHDINFYWDMDNIHDLIYGINLRENVINLSIHDKYILFDWNYMNFYFELTDDGMISMEIGMMGETFTSVYQKFMISMETQNQVKRLIPVEHTGNFHQKEECTDAIGDLFPHIDAAQFLD
jgi:hypothetical protein